MKKYEWKPSAGDWHHLYALAESALNNIDNWETMSVDDWVLYRRRDVGNVISSLEHFLTGSLPTIEMCMPRADRNIIKAAYEGAQRLIERAMDADGEDDSRRLQDEFRAWKKEVLDG